MKIKRKKFEEVSPIDFLILRDELGLKRFKKVRKREPEEREILIELALKKMKEKEENDYQIIGEKKRKLKIVNKNA